MRHVPREAIDGFTSEFIKVLIIYTRRRVLQYTEDNEFTKACEALLSDPPVAPTAAALEQIQKLHPKRAPLSQQAAVNNCQMYPLPFQPEEVATAIRSFRKASGQDLVG